MIMKVDDSLKVASDAFQFVQTVHYQLIKKPEQHKLINLYVFCVEFASKNVQQELYVL